LTALQSPIEYQKEQSQSAASTLRKTNSQPAAMMQSTLSRPTNSSAAHSHYTRMSSVPQSKTTAAVSRLKSYDVKAQKTVSSGAEKVKGQESKGQRAGSPRGQRAGSPQQSKRTIFAGLRSSLSRLSKSPSHEDLVRETDAPHNTTATTTTTTAAGDAAADDMRVNGDADKVEASDVTSSEQDGDVNERCQPDSHETSLTDCTVNVQHGN